LEGVVLYFIAIM